jgi:tetratricopeptide (TPR) repeat protein
VEAADALAQARALHRWGRSFWQTGNYVGAQPYLEQALALARAEGGQVEEAESLYDLGCVAYYKEDFARALATIEEAASLYAELNDPRGQAVCLSLYAVILDRTGDNFAAIAPFAQALRLCREAGWRYAEARLLAQSANNHLNLGDLASSRREHEQAIAICREINDREGIATSLDALGLILSFQDRPADARTCYEEALAIHRAMDDPRGQGYVYTHLGYALIELEEPELAEEALQRGAALRRSGAEGGLLADSLAGLALAALLRAAPEDALPYVAEIQAWLAANGATGVEFPVQVYLVCYRVLRAAAAFDAAYAQQAAAALASGHALLQERAARIPDDQLRAQFLTNIPYHRELLRGWAG